MLPVLSLVPLLVDVDQQPVARHSIRRQRSTKAISLGYRFLLRNGLQGLQIGCKQPL